MNHPIIIVGGGIAGLACARRLSARGVTVQVLEATGRVGGRIKTDCIDGYLLDRGFQVLQTAYPEARRAFDYPRLRLRNFAPGAMVRIRGRFYSLADPLRRPGKLTDTLTAPIGSMADRLRLLRLARRVTRAPLDALFRQPESTAMDFLRAEGFSDAMIRRFFVPFFGGVCLDPQIRASSRVLQYVLRMFVRGEAALPARGMQQIPLQLAADLPMGCLRTGVRVRQVNSDGVTLDDATKMPARAVVVATEAPTTARLLGLAATRSSVAETCLYFSSDASDWHSSFLVLNGEGRGPINNIAFPSRVSSEYAPVGKSLVSVVVLGSPNDGEAALVNRVKSQLVDWFGREAANWDHLHTYRITHALPDQSPKTQNPTCPNPRIRAGVFVCGEFGSLPGIQWALVSGRVAADAVFAHLNDAQGAGCDPTARLPGVRSPNMPADD
jgi:phytoene dehydrogenase-like protein